MSIKPTPDTITWTFGFPEYDLEKCVGLFSDVMKD